MKAGYRVILGETVVTSVNVLFDEAIPERSGIAESSTRRWWKSIQRSDK